MSKRKLLAILLFIPLGIVILFGILLLANPWGLFAFGDNGDANKEYNRIEAISSQINLPSELTLEKKNKIYDALSTADGAGWEYTYQSSTNAKNTCSAIRQSLENMNYIVSLSRTCIDYPSGIYEIFANNESDKVHVYSRIEGSGESSTARIEWSRLLQ